MIARYMEINSAFARAYFNEARAGEPVYLDLDDEALDSVASDLNIEADAIVDEITTTARSLLAIHQPRTPMFHSLSERLSRWARRVNRGTQLDDGSLPPPPIIAILAVFTLAAEQMGITDEAMGDNAYYPRLFKMLDIPDSDHGRFHNDFAKVSEWYWECLAAWLEMMDGDRGLPSAYALSHRYIGLPISQALVRETERRQLHRMFEDMGLMPGSPVSQYDMDAALDQWIGQAHSPASANLKGLWQRSGARDRVVDIALVEFEAWDGVARHSPRAKGVEGDSAQRSVRLAVQHSSDLFSSRYHFAVTMPRPRDTGDVTALELVVAEDASAEIAAIELGPGLDAVLFEDARIDTATALDGVMRFRAGARLLVRYPRKVVPLMLDPELNVLMETDTLASGSLAAVLVRDENGLTSRAAEILDRIARPGYAVQRGEETGIPAGWALITSVQAVKAYQGVDVPGNSPLTALLPRVNVQMSLSGGFKMPGRVPRWSMLDLPELAVVADEEIPLTVELQARSLASHLTESTPIAVGVPPLVVSLADHISAAGDYTVVLRKGQTKLQSMQIRARSAQAPDLLLWERFRPIAHVAGDPLWPLRASDVTADELPIVDGAMVGTEERAIVGDTREAIEAAWERPDRSPQAGSIIVPQPEATSCIQTGAHKWRLPTFHGKVSGRFVVNTCSTCGMTRRTPAHYKDKLLQKRSPVQTQVPTPAKALEPIAAKSIAWSAAIDSLFHLGTGSRSDLVSIARQIDNSAIFEHHFIRSLDSLGIIELSRDDKLQVTGWEVGSTVLAGLADGGTILTGVWVPSLTRTAYNAVAAERLILDAETTRRGYIDADPQTIFEAMGEPEDIAVAPDAGIEILLRLPHISTLVPSLATIPDPLAPGGHDVFSARDNRWIPAPPGAAGALRRRTFRGTQYYVRTYSDVSEQCVRPAQLDIAKYTAAWMAGVSLLKYDAREEVLRVPLGAPLPGLFERAAVLSSGVLPVPDRSTWSLVYTEVPGDFMSEMRTRLT